MKTHLIHKRDYPAFAPLAFLEITESFPQFIFQNVIFWMYHDLKRPWDTQKWVYVLSSLASIVAMVKAAFVYYQRYAIVKKGFNADSTRIDDWGYIWELFDSEGDVREIIKVIKRMEAQNSYNINERNKYRAYNK